MEVDVEGGGGQDESDVVCRAIEGRLSHVAGRGGRVSSKQEQLRGMGRKGREKYRDNSLKLQVRCRSVMQ